MMIVDVSPTGLTYDPPSDTATVFLSRGSAPPSSMPPQTPTSRQVPAQLLVDAKGFLVGVDLGDAYEGRRIAVMLGAHEDVAGTKQVTVSLQEEHARDPDALLTIRIPTARAAVRGNEKNPYL